MAFTPDILPITETDDDLRELLSSGVELPPLLPALAHTTGDLSLLRDELFLDPGKTLEEQGGWTETQQDLSRGLALDALARLRDIGPTPITDTGDLHSMMNFLTGTELTGSYVPMLTEELGLNNVDLRAPAWHKDALAPDRDFTVAIIGAGMSGILVAHRLKQTGVNVVLFEKNEAIGGTWLENTYPGCRVDVPNHVYCYSFMQKHDWPQFHSSQGVLLEYFNDCADEFDIRNDIRFSTEVSGLTWDDEQHVWSLEVVAPAGEETVEVNAVISAVGQLNRPKFPDIEGLADFAGPAWHSARWNHDVDLTGKRVGVIGTGCSASQFIPHVASQAEELTVFQRTPNWLMPRPEYTNALPDNLMWLFTHVPGYHSWFRLRLFWRSHEGLLSRMVVDREWDEPIEVSISEANDELRQLTTLYLESEFGDRPDLLEQVLPKFTVGAKRFVLDNGIWAKTLKQDHVELCSTGIERVMANGIRTTDGVEREFDVLLYGTGFQASSFLTPLKVVGRGGIDLHDSWSGDARAYLGVVSPGFPNFFYMYGPNTNIVINGSIIYFSECEAHYITEYIRHLLEHDRDALDVKPEVHDAYNVRVDEGNLCMAWGVSDVSSWYKTNGGRVAQNWPFSLREFWEQTREIDLSDYDVIN